MVIDIWLNLSMGRGSITLDQMDKSDVNVLEEAVGKNASCHIPVIIYLQVVVGPFER